MPHEPLPNVIKASDNGLVFACLLDGEGGGTEADWNAVRGWSEQDRPLWVHLDRSDAGTREWLEGQAGLSEITARALLEEETRPRVFSTSDGMVAILRGVNLNPGADPDDMVALRIFVDANRLITVRHRPLMTPRDLLSDLVHKGIGPRGIPELFVRLTERLTERMNSAVVALDEDLDAIEEDLETLESEIVRGRLADVRQSAVSLRRYIAPQREAISRVLIEHPVWLTREHEIALREAAEKLQRYVEDLDAARDRALVIRDEIQGQLAEAMNDRMYALAIIAGIFLPLSFLTGLLGINVGGMPGVENTWAFWVTCILLVLVLVLELYLFKRMKWI